MRTNVTFFTPGASRGASVLRSVGAASLGWFSLDWERGTCASEAMWRLLVEKHVACAWFLVACRGEMGQVKFVDRVSAKHGGSEECGFGYLWKEKETKRDRERERR